MTEKIIMKCRELEYRLDEGVIAFCGVIFEQVINLTGRNFGNRKSDYVLTFRNSEFRHEFNLSDTVFAKGVELDLRGVSFGRTLVLAFSKPPKIIYCDRHNAQKIKFAAPTIPLVIDWEIENHQQL